MSEYYRHPDDVDSYRSRGRDDEDRRQRYRDRSPSPPPPSAKRRKTGFDEEREKRMARLRQEMRAEDEELEALDQERKDLAADEMKPKPQETIIEVNEEELEGLDEEEQMKMLLGFQGFGSTKGQEVEDNKNSAAKGVAAKNKARKYRQYMNRKNGFNRPLEKMD